MRGSIRRLLVVAVTFFAVVATTACSGASSDNGNTPAPPGQPDKIAVGVIPIVDVAPIYLGKQKGFFASRNIELTLETSQGGAAIVPAVLNGQFQFGFSNVTSLVLAKARGVPIKMVANGVASTGANGQDYGAVLVKGNSPIRTAADLAGKTVSVNTLKNIGDTTVRASVRKAGGDDKAVKFLEMGFPDMPAALQAGRVDAIWVVEPFVTVAKGQGARVIASSYVDVAPDLTVATYFATQQLIAGNPDLVKRFREAIAESLTYANGHPDEVRAVLGTYTQIAPDIASKIILPKWPAEVNRQSIQTLAELAVNDGLLEKAPNLDELLP